MNKEDFVSMFVYALMIVFAAVIGFGVLTPLFRGMTNINGLSITWFLIISLVLSILLESALFELGHIIGAKRGGYEILYVNILGLQIYKDFTKNNSTWKVKFPKNFDGLAGETKISPIKEDANPKKVVLGPLVLYIIQILLMVILYIVIKDPSKGQNPFNWLKYFQLVIVSVGSLLFVYNYFPARLDTFTDGYRIVCLNKKTNVSAYNVLLKEEGDEYKGITVPEYKYFEEITDFTAQANLKLINSLILEGNLEKASQYVDRLEESLDAKLTIGTKSRIQTSKLFDLLWNDKLDEAKKLYETFEDATKYFLKNEYTMLTIRTSLLYFGLIEKTISECENQLKHRKKALEKESMKAQEIENQLLDNTLKRLESKGVVVKTTKEKKAD